MGNGEQGTRNAAAIQEWGMDAQSMRTNPEPCALSTRIVDLTRRAPVTGTSQRAMFPFLPYPFPTSRSLLKF